MVISGSYGNKFDGHGLGPCHDLIWCWVGWPEFCHLAQLFDGPITRSTITSVSYGNKRAWARATPQLDVVPSGP